MYYLNKHSNETNRLIHFVAITVILYSVILSVVMLNFWIGIIGIFSGCLMAWAAHFIFEENRPAMFQHPIWSVISGLRMYIYGLTGRLEIELKKSRR